MNDLIYRYTEERYAHPSKIKEQFKGALADTILKECNQYRKKYRISGEVLYPYQFCLCSGILKKIIEAKERFIVHQELSYDTLSITYEGILNQEMILMVLRWQAKHSSLDEMLQEIKRLFKEENLDIWASFIKNNQLCAECRWIVIFSQLHGAFAVLIFLAMNLEYHFMDEGNVAAEYLLSIEYMEDNTYALQGMLDYILNSVLIISEEKRKEYEDLQCLYPQLKEYQLRFYLEHCTKGYYYTIKQFVNSTHVSKETARCAMEQLVELNFYIKLKKGKKFVYTCTL